MPLQAGNFPPSVLDACEHLLAWSRSWRPSQAWMMASNSDETTSVSGISDSHVVNLPGEAEPSGSVSTPVDSSNGDLRPSSSSSGSPGADDVKGGAPRDASHPWTFIKGPSYLGRSFEEIRRKERSAVLPDPPEGGKFSDDIEATLVSGWEGKGWEEAPQRVENLVWIKRNTFYKEVLDDCKEQRKEYAAKIKDGQKSLGDVTNEIYNLIGFFSVFQGVILTAVTQLAGRESKLLCGKVWFPVALSVLAGLIAVGGIAFKNRQSHAHEKEIFRNKDYYTRYKRREGDLKAKGENFYFGGTEEERVNKKQVENKLELLSPSKRIFKFVIVSVLVILVTAVFIMSYFVILCDKLVIN